jgi:hypothetical protein
MVFNMICVVVAEGGQSRGEGERRWSLQERVRFKPGECGEDRHA